jgi:hypothetical protein
LKDQKGEWETPKKNNNNSLPNSLNEDHAKAQKQITIPAENRKNPLKQNKTPPEKQNKKALSVRTRQKPKKTVKMNERFNPTAQAKTPPKTKKNKQIAVKNFPSTKQYQLILLDPAAIWLRLSYASRTSRDGEAWRTAQ